MNRHFSAGAFLQGIAAFALLLLAAAGVAQLNAKKTVARLETRLASQTALVDRNPALKNTSSPPPGKALNEAHPAPALPETTDSSALPAAPIDGLYEATTQGPKPVIRVQDGLTAFRAYRRPFDSHASDAPSIALALADAALSGARAETALAILPPEISFIASPYAPALDFWVREARARGHEIWLSLPVESAGYPENDTGPHTLLIDAPESENLAKLDWLMTRTTGYVGFVTARKAVFMDSAGDMRPITGAIFSRGLALVDGSESPGVVQQAMANGAKAPYSNIDVWIGSQDSSPESIRQSLQKLEALAKERGAASGVIHPLPGTYQEILSWIKTFPEKNLRLAPLSATTGY